MSGFIRNFAICFIDLKGTSIGFVGSLEGRKDMHANNYSVQKKKKKN